MREADSDVCAYLPASLARAVSVGGSRSVPWCDEVEGTLVMADLSGFTPLSECLARLGDVGAERLTTVVNAFFAALLGTASRYGGDTLTFGGDAILLLFRGGGHAERAAAAALAMLKQTASDGGRRLRGRAHQARHVGGGAQRRLPLCVVGKAERSLHLFVIGSGAEATAAAEARAERGELVVTDATRALLEAEAAGRPGAQWGFSPAGDFWRADVAPASAAARPPAQLQRVSVASCRGHLAVSPHSCHPMRGRAPPLSGSAVSPSTGASPWCSSPSLGSRNPWAQPARRPRSGCCRSTSRPCPVSPSGTTASSSAATSRRRGRQSSDVRRSRGARVLGGQRCALCGRPQRVARGVRAASRHRIGVNGGHVFAGEVGPAWRRQYTVMGDAVNLAARLMAAAGSGQAVAGGKLSRAAGVAVRVRELPPLTVKGKSEPVAACLLLGYDRDRLTEAAAARFGELGLVGRTRELTELEGAMRRRSRTGDAPCSSWVRRGSARPGFSTRRFAASRRGRG